MSGDWALKYLNVVVQKTTGLQVWRCIWDCGPAESIVHPPPDSKILTTPSSKISQYYFASNFPSTSMRFPIPFQPIQPHTMRLLPPPCLTVWVVVQSDTGSPCCFQMYTLPSDPIQLILVSSHNLTLVGLILS